MANDERAGDKRKPRKRPDRGPAVFINKSQLAAAMGGISVQTIDAGVRRGSIPPPHSRPTERVTLWRRSHFEHFVEHGLWPPEAWGLKVSPGSSRGVAGGRRSG